VPGHGDGRGPTSKTEFLRALLSRCGVDRGRFLS